MMEYAVPSPTPSSSSTLNEFKPAPPKLLGSQETLRRSRFSIPSFGRFRKGNTPASSTTSLSDAGSDTTISEVPTRFVLNVTLFSKGSPPKSGSIRGSQVYRPAKYAKRCSAKDLKTLPHQLQILHDRGTAPLSKDYELLNRKLGDGAMGSVYLVQRKTDRRLFAAKIHSKDHPKLSKIQYLERIADEVVIASSMHHPNVIATVDFVSNGGKYMTIMEYCPSDLFDIIAANTLDSHQIDQYFVQLLLGVQHLHSQGVAHRDLKLENLCVNANGQLKIIDFGCSISFRNPMSQEASAVKGVFGSDPYIAPEIWSQYLYDAAKADLWSLGVVYVAMHSGRFLWDRAQPQDSRYSRFLAKAGHTFNKFNVPEHAQPLLLRLLDPNPVSRATLADALEEPWVQRILTGGH